MNGSSRRWWERGLLVALALLGGTLAPSWGQRSVPLERRLLNTTLARDLLEGRPGPSLTDLEREGEEIPLGIPARWGQDRFELVKGQGPDGSQSLLAFDHKARRWWRLDGCPAEAGPFTLRRSLLPDGAPGSGVITRCPGEPDAPFGYFQLTPKGIERLARFDVPWAELDREVLAYLHRQDLKVTSADTSWLALSRLEDLDPEEGGGRTSLQGEVFVGRLEEYTHAAEHADPTLGLTVREIMLTRDWLPPGVVRATFNLLPGMVRVGEVDGYREEAWKAPKEKPAVWVLPRPRPDPDED